MVAELENVPLPRSPLAWREVLRDSGLRRARTCYDHLAGVAGVFLLDEILSRHWLRARRGARVHYSLTPEGERALSERSVDVSQARRQRRLFAFGCLDWTERRPHLGGGLAALILASLRNGGYIDRAKGTRTVSVNEPLLGWLDGLAA